MKYKFTTQYDFPDTIFILIEDLTLMDNVLFHDLLKKKHGQTAIIKMYLQDNGKYAVRGNVPPPISPSGDYSGWNWESGNVES